MSLTSVTAMPASLNARAEPPVDKRVTPLSCNALPSSISPVLSDTDKSARLIAVVDDIIVSPYDSIWPYNMAALRLYFMMRPIFHKVRRLSTLMASFIAPILCAFHKRPSCGN